MKQNRRSPLLWSGLLLLTLALGVGACADSKPPATTQMQGNNGNNGTNNGGTNNGANNTPIGQASLSHVSDASTALVSNSSVTLQVRYQDGNGNTLSDKAVRWEIIGESANSRLDARSSNTDSQGVASMTVFSDVQEATFEVEASVDDSGVSPIRFTVSVESKDFASYRVVVDYFGARDYSRSEVKVALYEAPENCVEFNPLRPSTAEQSQVRPVNGQGFPINFTFTNLRNGTRYLAVATANAVDNGQDVVIGSWGCNDERPQITDGQNPDALTVQMTDALPDITGSWRVDSRFNLSDGLPPNVRAVVDPILDLFTDPSAFLARYIAQIAEDQFGLSSESIETIIAGVTEDLLNSVLGGNETVQTVLVGGADIAEAIRNFNLLGRITIEDGDISSSGLIEGADLVYDRLGYRWRLNCESDEQYQQDPSCGDDFVSLGGFGEGAIPLVEAQWSGAVVTNSEYDPSRGRTWFHELSVEDHTVDFAYGAIVLFMIENVALPQLFPAENGMPAVSSINALLARFVDCAELFDNNTFQSVCEVARDGISDLIRGQLNDLEFGSDNFTVGTPDGKACGLHEQTENYGSPAPNQAHFPRFSRMGLNDPDNVDFGDLRCQWGATIQWSADPQDQTNVSGRWYGERSGQ